MKKIQKVCLSLFMSSVLLASGVISKAINCDVVLSGDEIMPTDLYDVDFDQALQKNLKSADVIVLGDFEFQDTRVSVRTDVSAQTLSYPNVQSFQKVYNKAEELIIEYNEDCLLYTSRCV